MEPEINSVTFRQQLKTGKPLLGQVCDVRLDRDTWSGDYADVRVLWQPGANSRMFRERQFTIRLSESELVEVTLEFIETPVGIYDIVEEPIT